MAELTYKQLLKATTALRDDVTKGSEASRGEARRIDDEAKDTDRVAEMIGGMGVDTSTIAETTELSKIMQGLSEASIAYASAGDTTAKAAQAAHDQTRTSHGGIQEAYSRAPVDISNMKPEWLRQQ